MKEVSNNRPFVRSNLVRYTGQSHNTNSIPKQFIRNNVRPSHHTWHIHHTPASQYHSQNKTIQWLMPVTTLVATVPNDLLRGCACTRGTNAKHRTRDRQLGVAWILTETVEKKRCYWHDPSHSAWPWRWTANSFEKAKSLTQRCVRVGYQLNSDQALRLLFSKRHVRARDSTLWRHQQTRSEWTVVYENT